MADPGAFELASSELEQQTTLERLEARGTVRIALKDAGLDVRTATPQEFAVAIERLLPGHLESRGIDGAEDLCRRLANRLGALASEPRESESPEAIFARLGSTGS